MKKIQTTLLAIGLIAAALPACKKSASTTPAIDSTTAITTSSAPTSGMGGVRHWHRHHHYEASGPHFPASVNEGAFGADTTFAVTISGDSAVNMFGTAYQFSTTDTVKKIRYFGQAYYYYYYGMGAGVAYFFAKDSIAWCNGDLHHTSDYWELKDACYTY